MRLGALAVVATVAMLTAGCTSLLDLKLPPDVDHDSDNRPDGEDNCPDIANPDQSDFDHNGIGDACDVCLDGGFEDVDHDGISDGCDGCVGNGMDADHDGSPDGCIPSGADKDADGVDDACESCDSCVESGMDKNHDGVDDACEVTCVPIGVDSDGDGIDDACDDCMNLYVDADGDGIDDGCDPCPLGAQHDEDNDGIYDACDNCKALANAGQADGGDAKGPDGVGERCDPDPASDHEIFDAFAAYRAAWYVQGANWKLSADSMSFLGGGTSYRSLGHAAGFFVVTTEIHPSTATTPGSASYGIYATLVDLQPAPSRLSCIIKTSTTSLGPTLTAAVYNDDPTNPVSSGATPTTDGAITLQMTVDETADTVMCTTVSPAGTNTASAKLATTGVDWHPGLVADRIASDPIDFRYFDVVTR